jgi:hypothetical protein
MPDPIRLVPKYASDEDAHDVSEKHGWEPTENHGEELQQWTLPEADAKVTWFEDPSTDVQQFAVEGKDAQQAVDQIEAAVDILHPADFEAYMARFKGERNGLMKGLDSIGVVAASEKPSAGVIELYERYLGHEDPLVRRAALFSAGLTGWSELVKPVEALREDPEKAVREDAEAALEALHGAA